MQLLTLNFMGRKQPACIVSFKTKQPNQLIGLFSCQTNDSRFIVVLNLDNMMTAQLIYFQKQLRKQQSITLQLEFQQQLLQQLEQLLGHVLLHCLELLRILYQR